MRFIASPIRFGGTCSTNIPYKAERDKFMELRCSKNTSNTLEIVIIFQNSST